MESSQLGMMRLNELEQQLGNFSESAIENKISFLEMLQCIEPNHILQFQTLEPESSLTFQTTKPDPGQTNDSETKTGAKESTVVVKERRKRKRTRTPKNKDEVENQRMTHIAVERNRRRLMNEHLNSLKSLMPPSFLQRGDQASIVGGAIDFIKELEQLLLSLEEEKKRHDVHNENAKTASSSSSSSRACTTTTSSVSSISTTSSEDGFTARFGSGETAEVEATVIQNHVNLKVKCKRRQGQILKAIVAIEDMKLTILHLTLSSSFHFAFYSFNLKIEDGCKVRTADEIATTVHLIFQQINSAVI